MSFGVYKLTTLYTATAALLLLSSISLAGSNEIVEEEAVCYEASYYEEASQQDFLERNVTRSEVYGLVGYNHFQYFLDELKAKKVNPNNYHLNIAIAAFKKALEQNDSWINKHRSYIYSRLGCVYDAAGKCDEAIDALENALKYNDRDEVYFSDIYYILGNNYFYTDKLPAAVNSYNKAFREDDLWIKNPNNLRKVERAKALADFSCLMRDIECETPIQSPSTTDKIEL